jgi:hypothetical protein
MGHVLPPETSSMKNRHPGTDAGRARRILLGASGVLLACAMVGAGWYLHREFAQPLLQPAAHWSTDTANWDMAMTESVRSVGVAANNIRFEQNGRDLRIALRNLAIEKHPAAAEIRIVAVAVRIDPPIGPAPAPQPMEGVLNRQKPVMTRTTVAITVPGGVTCLKTAACTFWLELTLQPPGGPPHVESSRRIPIPARPVV